MYSTRIKCQKKKKKKNDKAKNSGRVKLVLQWDNPHSHHMISDLLFLIYI